MYYFANKTDITTIFLCLVIFIAPIFAEKLSEPEVNPLFDIFNSSYSLNVPMIPSHDTTFRFSSISKMKYREPHEFRCGPHSGSNVSSMLTPQHIPCFLQFYLDYSKHGPTRNRPSLPPVSSITCAFFDLSTMNLGNLANPITTFTATPLYDETTNTASFLHPLDPALFLIDLPPHTQQLPRRHKNNFTHLAIEDNTDEIDNVQVFNVWCDITFEKPGELDLKYDTPIEILINDQILVSVTPFWTQSLNSVENIPDPIPDQSSVPPSTTFLSYTRGNTDWFEFVLKHAKLPRQYAKHYIVQNFDLTFPFNFFSLTNPSSSHYITPYNPFSQIVTSSLSSWPQIILSFHGFGFFIPYLNWENTMCMINGIALNAEVLDHHVLIKLNANAFSRIFLTSKHWQIRCPTIALYIATHISIPDNQILKPTIAVEIGGFHNFYQHSGSITLPLTQVVSGSSPAPVGLPRITPFGNGLSFIPKHVSSLLDNVLTCSWRIEIDKFRYASAHRLHIAVTGLVPELHTPTNNTVMTITLTPFIKHHYSNFQQNPYTNFQLKTAQVFIVPIRVDWATGDGLGVEKLPVLNQTASLAEDALTIFPLSLFNYKPGTQHLVKEYDVGYDITVTIEGNNMFQTVYDKIECMLTFQYASNNILEHHENNYYDNIYNRNGESNSETYYYNHSNDRNHSLSNRTDALIAKGTSTSLQIKPSEHWHRHVTGIHLLGPYVSFTNFLKKIEISLVRARSDGIRLIIESGPENFSISFSHLSIELLGSGYRFALHPNIPSLDVLDDWHWARAANEIGDITFIPQYNATQQLDNVSQRSIHVYSKNIIECDKYLELDIFGFGIVPTNILPPYDPDSLLSILITIDLWQYHPGHEDFQGCVAIPMTFLLHVTPHGSGVMTSRGRPTASGFEILSNHNIIPTLIEQPVDNFFVTNIISLIFFLILAVPIVALFILNVYLFLRVLGYKHGYARDSMAVDIEDLMESAASNSSV